MAGLRTVLAYQRQVRDQWKPAGELLALQRSRLRDLVHHAYERHPFYKNLFDGIGLKPGDIKTGEDLKRLPVLTKEALRRAISESGNIPERSAWITTSGSTGIRMRFPLRRGDRSRLNLTWFRPLRAHGIPPRARILEITGPHNIESRPFWYQRMGLWRRKSISIFESEEKWVEALTSFRPDVLWGYSGSLKLLARHVDENPRPGFIPRWVVGVSDLVDEEGRELIRRAFKTELIDIYGAAEAGCISWICPECGEYHVNIDHLIVEFDPLPVPDHSQNPCKIYVTNLYSFAFPIIRYDLGDIGFPSTRPPACGRGLPLMRIVEGRFDAVIRLPSGRLISPLFFFAVMKKISGIAQWRIIQSDPGGIRVVVVPAADRTFTAAEAREKIGNVVAEPLRIDIEVVASIPSAPNGKQCAVLSTLSSHTDGTALGI